MSRRLVHYGRIAAKRPRCTQGHHFGPFTPRVDIRDWLIRMGCEDVPEQYDCARCGSTCSIDRQVAA